MPTALFADIHANRQAFEACLADAARRGAESIVLMGDYVGYGGDPEWVTHKVIELVAAGARAIRGNHDTALRDTSIDLNPQAAAAMHWTRSQLDRASRDVLAALPLTLRSGDVLYVHADASQPSVWNYISDATEAGRSLRGTDAAIVFSAHIHRPAVYSVSATGKMTSFRPTTGIPVQLTPGRRWQIVLGAVGQPRDGIAAASYALFDETLRTVEFCRVPYDIDAAAARIIENRLPAWLAERLYKGV